MKKPAIAKPRLTWKLNHRKTAWAPYYRVTWTEGGKRRERAILLDWQGDAQKLDELYWACRSGRHAAQKPKVEHSWRACIIAWRSDPKVQGRLADSTKRSYRRAMDRIMEKNGDKDMRRTTKEALYRAHLAMSATPREADRMLQTVSILWGYAANSLFWPMPPNPASGIEHFGKQREYEPWPDWMIAALAEAPEDVQIAARLIRGTGQRPGAAIAMRRDQFRGEYMTVIDEKGKQELEVYCPPSLAGFVAGLPGRGDFILGKTPIEPLSYDAVERKFRAWRKGLGAKARPYTLHGLRKLAIVELAEAGASDAEIQAVTGQSAEMVAYYRKKASRKRLSKSAQQRRDRP
ncbi:Phage integrase family [Marinovum algicola DG 898]|nr:Phage integrase family [Marinovum algicola DG 898]